MSDYGIRATNLVGMESNNPHLVAVDSRQQGGMSIDKILYYHEEPSTYTRSYTNAGGRQVGVIEYYHGFGYPPAFMLYQYVTPYVFVDGSNQAFPNNGDGYMTPSAGAIGSVGLIGYSDNQKITIDGLDYTGGTLVNGPNGGWMILVVFKENLDADNV